MLRHCLLLLAIATLTACAGRRDAQTAATPDIGAAEAPTTVAQPAAPDALVLERTIAAHLRFLASDALAGRGSGTRDEWITATYLGARLAELGLEPMGDDGWFVQPVEVQRFTITGMPTLAIGERTLTHGSEMLVRSVMAARITGPLRQVVAGQPVAPGSVVVVPADAPPEVQAAVARAAVVLLRETPAVRARWARAAAAPPSAAGQLVNVPAAQPAGPTVITLDTTSHDAALSAPDGTTVTFEATIEPGDRTTTWNAVGRLPGREPAGASEIIVLSAHLDHVGTQPAPADNPGADVIYNGADDDASGVVAVLELARALVAGPRPRRTVVFAFFGSEEAGGFGSRYFVTRPTVPLTDIVANLQFEMIGRPDPAVPPGTLWLTGFERSTLGTSLAAHGANLVQDPHPAERFFERSDNIQFARRGVVAHTVSSYGLHQEYHQPSDEFRHINLAHMREAIASLVAPVRWLADTDTRPAWHAWPATLTQAIVTMSSLPGIPLSRRDILRHAWLVPLAPLAACQRAAAPAVAASRPTDIRIVEVQHDFEEYAYRLPYQFGGRTVDHVTLLNVHCRVRTGDGREAWGFGSMTLGNAWAFPAASHDAGLGAMKALAVELRALTAACDDTGHPVDLFHVLEPEYLRAAASVSQQQALPSPIPKLCTLVVASPFDAALHDAYGKVFGVSSYATYGPEHMRHDLSRDLGPAFAGEYLDRYVPVQPRATTPVFHSVGASDALEAADVRTPIDDGLPNTLEEWIPRDGLTRFKIKLNGGNADADVERIVRIDRLVTRMQQPGHEEPKYLLDFNEGCPNVGYLLDVLRRVREATPAGFDRVLYIEQPTSRDLRRDPTNTMHEAAKLRPVVIDESLTDLETLLLAREMGYTGVALKACKGQSHAMLMAAAAQKYGMFLCVQDLTCPGASLIHSAGIAARVPGNAGIEANARQFVPAASAAWEPRFPGLFTIRGGVMQTGQLTGPGLGAVPPRSTAG